MELTLFHQITHFMVLKKLVLFFFAGLLLTNAGLFSQSIIDDFEKNSVLSWRGDDCIINIGIDNPLKAGINLSSKVLQYNDIGGQYANVQLDIEKKFNLIENYSFSFQIYVPSTEITGNQPLQVSLKLQDNTDERPWELQTEIIKPIVLNQWQTITFDFKNDNYINLNGGSPPPTFRKDFNRVVIQVNGENNNDRVVAFLDNFYYQNETTSLTEYDHLVWSDEFEVEGEVDKSKWHHQTLIPQGDSWFNGEVQHYTNRKENSIVENGVLKIIGRKEKFTNQGVTKDYTSARLNSKFAFQYGKVEIRAKLPSGIGTWPALWTLGKNITERGGYWMEQGYGTTSWPACGEIDIMEHWGHNPNFIQSATHTPSSFGNTFNHGGQNIPTASTDFHIYTLEWYPERLVFSVDDNIHYIYEPSIRNSETWPFDAEQYILMNFAIQPSIYPAFLQDAMEVDYLRIYQNKPSNVSDLTVKNITKLYPNPVEEQLILEMDFPQNIGPLTIYIYDASGQLKHTSQYPISNQRLTIDNINNLRSGIYFVAFENGENMEVIQFFKK